MNPLSPNLPLDITLCDIVNEVLAEPRIPKISKKLVTEGTSMDSQSTVDTFTARNNIRVRNKLTEHELQLFYKGIHLFGSDVSMIHAALLSHKTYRQVSLFFKKENRKNSSLIDKALRFNRRNRHQISVMISDVIKDNANLIEFGNYNEIVDNIDMGSLHLGKRDEIHFENFIEICE